MTHELSGPDFLLAVADAERAMGNPQNADTYARRAREWEHDLAERDRATQQVDDLTFRVAEIQRAAATTNAAIAAATTTAANAAPAH